MVLEVREKTGRKYTLFLDGERYCRCYPGDLRALGFSDFSEGQETEVTGERLAELERTVFLPRAKRRSLMLLGKLLYFPWHFQLFTVGRIVHTSQPIFQWWNFYGRTAQSTYDGSWSRECVS